MTNQTTDLKLDNTQEFIVESSRHATVVREKQSSYPYFSEGEPIIR